MNKCNKKIKKAIVNQSKEAKLMEYVKFGQKLKFAIKKVMDKSNSQKKKTNINHSKEAKIMEQLL